MKPINSEPIWVDFCNSDEDGAVRLLLPIESIKHERLNLNFVEGQVVWVTDGDVEEFGILKFRDGMWVAISLKGTFKDVDKDSPYYIGNV
ncbi:MAG: hypothetical protein NTV81_04790 [Candidatus Komeilibacteria bacterium]|nr:hypothetical protein [Candidatus Komeilibacteria bacterium]